MKGKCVVGSGQQAVGSGQKISKSPNLQISKSSNPQSPIPNPSSVFRLLLDPPDAGPWNMAVDEAMLEAAAAEGQCMLRFYRWQQATLSLGYFQVYADRQRHEASLACPTVRRLSGGGAIVHDAELTYSLAVPSRHCLAVDRLGLYRTVHATLIEALRQWGIEATMVPSPAPFHQSGEEKTSKGLPFLCFQRRSPGDVLVGTTKVAGSAQRRCLGAVLQHGSVLLARSSAAPELAGLAELTGKTIAPDQLAEAWQVQLAKTLKIAWQSGTLSDDCRRRAAQLAADKYASPAWTENRSRGQKL